MREESDTAFPLVSPHLPRFDSANFVVSAVASLAVVK